MSTYQSSKAMSVFQRLIVSAIFVLVPISASLAQDGLSQPQFPSAAGTLRGVSDPFRPLGGDAGPGLAMRDSVSAYYTLGLPSVSPSNATTAEEKVINLTLSVGMFEPVFMTINKSSLKVEFEDMIGFRHEADELRIAGMTELADSVLVDGSKMTINAVANIPAERWINKVYISDSRGEWEHEIALTDVGKLPDSVSADGRAVEPTVSAKQGTWYPLGTVDVRVKSWSIAEEGVADIAANETYDYAVANVGVRNRANQEIRLHKGLFQGTTMHADDRNYSATSLLFEQSDRTVDFPMLPGQEVNVRMVYRLPKDAKATELLVVEKIGGRSGALSRGYNIDLAATAPGLLASGTVGIESFQKQGFVASNDLMERPQVADPSAPASIGTTMPNEQLADTSELPYSVTGMGTPMVERNDQVVLEPVQQVTAEFPQLDFPDTRYVARMRSYVVKYQQENGGDEPWLVVVRMQGRLGDNNNPATVFARDRDRNFLGPVDWAVRDTSRSIAGNKIAVREFLPARPYEIHAYVVLAFEGDNSSDNERRDVAGRVASSIHKVWRDEISRNPGLDYSDLNQVNRDRIVAEFKATAERLQKDFRAAAKNAESRFDWSSGDTDEYMGSDALIWIHVDDAGNPGALHDDKYRRPVAREHVFDFGGNLGNVLPAMIEGVPPDYELQFEITAEVP